LFSRDKRYFLGASEKEKKIFLEAETSSWQRLGQSRRTGRQWPQSC